MAGILRVPRSRGALSGLLLVLLGAWGALIPFIGPYFHYAFTPDRAGAYNTGRLWLEILPGAVTLLGGLIVLLAATRPAAVFGAWLAAMSGAWFVVGRSLSVVWTTGGTLAGGHAVGGTVTRAVEEIGFFTGLGAVVIFFAAMALGRFTVIGVREAALGAGEPVATEPADRERAGTEPADPADREPADREPVNTAPVSTAPVSTAPVSTAPVNTERVTTERTTTAPVTSQTAGTDPAYTDPAGTDPAYTDPAYPGPAGTTDPAVTDRPVGRHSAQGSGSAP